MSPRTVILIGTLVYLGIDYCGSVIEARGWLYDHWGEVMEKYRDEMFHSVNSVYIKL